MTFGTRVRTLHDVGQPISQLETRPEDARRSGHIRSVRRARGRIAESVRSANRSARPFLCLPTASIPRANPVSDVLLEAQKAGALLYFIPIGSRILIDEHTIDSLAKETGGRVIYLQKSDRVPPAMETIRQELARQYYIGYYTSRKPGFHSIRVEVPGSRRQDSRKVRLLQLLNGPLLSETRLIKVLPVCVVEPVFEEEADG